MRRRASPGPLGALGITSGDGADDAAGTGTSTGTSARPGTGTGTTTDPQGTHEILSLLHGEPAFSPWPPPLQSLAGIRELASWLGDYHRAVRDFRPPADALWQGQEEEWRLGMVIRHGDLGPWNSIWNGDRLAGFIDWDFAAPGHALGDLAQLAW